jgi:hypothetical protein
MNFISKGSQLSVLQLKGWFKFKSSMWRIKNQPSNSTSCRDNALHLLALVTTILYWILSSDVVFVFNGLDHIFIRLGPVPPTPPSLPGLHVRTCMGTLPHWEPMWRYSVKITNIQVDIISNVPKLIGEVPSHTKGAWWLMWPCIVTLVPSREKIPYRCGREDQRVKEA